MSARCGWTGKLPSTGDFLSRGVAPEFATPWQRWLDSLLVASRAILGETWSARFRSVPAWRFVLGPGVLSENGWAGVMVPSVDCVGRYYPLTIVCGLGPAPFDPGRTLEVLAPWLDAVEAVALEALSPAADADAVDAAVRALPLPSVPRDSAGVGGVPRSAWSARESDLGSGWRFAVQGMPDVRRYCEMLTGTTPREAELR